MHRDEATPGCLPPVSLAGTVCDGVSGFCFPHLAVGPGVVAAIASAVVAALGHPPVANSPCACPLPGRAANERRAGQQPSQLRGCAGVWIDSSAGVSLEKRSAKLAGGRRAD